MCPVTAELIDVGGQTHDDGNSHISQYCERPYNPRTFQLLTVLILYTNYFPI
jgi:hypothetical protein